MPVASSHAKAGPLAHAPVLQEDEASPQRGIIMKSIFDSSFRYRPSFRTDVRETFLRIREEQQAELRHEQRAAQIRHQQQAGADTSHNVSD
jgi:hypothetical protein